MAEWQTIDTAPDDGTIHVRGLWVTVKWNGGPEEREWRQYVGYIEDESGRFIDTEYQQDFGWEAEDFSHWLHLPSPPLAAAPKLAGEEKT